MLDYYDPDFSYLFKVLADFDTTIARDRQGVQYYAGILSRITRQEDLLAFDRSAVKAMTGPVFTAKSYSSGIPSMPRRFSLAFSEAVIGLKPSLRRYASIRAASDCSFPTRLTDTLT